MKAKLSPLEWVLAISFGLGVYGSVMAAVWLLWGYAWSGLWPEGPEMLIDPPYLPFVAATMLVVWLRSFLGGKK
jgi:hypothetical protein